MAIARAGADGTWEELEAGLLACATPEPNLAFSRAATAMARHRDREAQLHGRHEEHSGGGLPQEISV